MLRRLTLIDQIEFEIKQRISNGLWREQLPAERSMCVELRVGRNSLRAALARLKQEGLVVIEPGVGISARHISSGTAYQAQETVALLSPVPLEKLRPHQTLWIDELRGLLAEKEVMMRFHCEPRCFGPRAPKAIDKFVRLHTANCWVLVHSTLTMQDWFKASRTPCVIAGSCHEGVDLPYVDLNHHATCRHAAITFLRLGHRRVAFLTRLAENAGDQQSERGFMEGVAEYEDRQAVGTVLHLDNNKRHTARLIGRLMARNDAPTAILVNQSYHYLTVFSILMQMGKSIPANVSLICRDHDNFLSFLEPTPAYYGDDAKLFSKKMIRVLTAVMAGAPSSNTRVNLLPELIMGSSIAPLAPV
jgi:hypothetical protein